jgi:membrane protease YdiL (CAAX protease family)
VFVIAFIASGLLAAPAFAVTNDRAIRWAAVAWTGEIGFIMAVPFWVRTVRSAPLALLGLPRRPRRDLMEGLVMGITLVVAGFVAAVVVQSVATLILGHEPHTGSQVPKYVTGPILGAIGPSVVLAAPVGEELFFRGLLYRGLRRRMDVRPAIITSAIVFGMVHLVGGLSLWPLVPPLAVVGAGLALIYERRQSLLASVTAHAVFNLVGFAVILASRL